VKERERERIYFIISLSLERKLHYVRNLNK
jgi:hypothetical protein